MQKALPIHDTEVPKYSQLLSLRCSPQHANPSLDFRFIEVFAGEEPTLTVDGVGHIETPRHLTASGLLSMDNGADISSQSRAATRDAPRDALRDAPGRLEIQVRIPSSNLFVF